MDKIDWFVLIVFSLLAGLIAGVLFSEICNSLERDALYSECIKTKYDKFQCYSMIHGSK